MKTKEEDTVYRTLQEHLDRQPVGFPAVSSGADIRLLKHFFTPAEARIALNLDYRFQPLSEIAGASSRLDLNSEELAVALEGMAAKGCIAVRVRDGERFYKTIPLVVGMYEAKLYDLTPEFLQDFEAYTREKAFGLEFLATDLPQMRTIPIEASVTPRYEIATYDSLRDIIETTEGPIVINECICRKAQEMRGEPCKKTERLETCMAFRDVARMCIQYGKGRPLDKAEALEIARRNEEDGLVLQPSNTRAPDFICACCACCCGMLKMHRLLPRPMDFWAANFQAVVDKAKCTACGLCVERCQVAAASMAAGGEAAVISRQRCIGCGLCVPTCPAGAIRLEPAKAATVPPSTEDDLYEHIMSHKKGAWGKMKVAARLARRRR